jgi:hypothetical protein
MNIRWRTLALLSIIVFAGFAFKYYPGPGHSWFNLYGAGVLYEVFWCLVAFCFFPRSQNMPIIAAAVFVCTCVLETAQLWHHPLLEEIRRFRIGVWLIGDGFDWWDFPHYAAGCALGWAILRTLQNSKRQQ